MTRYFIDNSWHYVLRIFQEIAANYLQLSPKLLGNIIINFLPGQVFIETYLPEIVCFLWAMKA